jgi:EAL domain-containing protein (putative c-di-GMP-specific phosphodiesterase class I)
MGIEDFPFVEIKLAREFASGCADQSLKRAVCRQIIDLADGVGARSVAEGVETLEDYFALRDMGVTQIQGFLFGKPMTRQKFARDAQVLETEAGRKVHGALPLL